MRKSILIILFSLLGVLSAQAYDYDFKVDGIYYNLISGTDGQVEVTYKELYGDSYSGSVVIPSTVTYSGTTYAVTSIGNHAFSRCRGLTSVSIPESVTSIGNSAFSGCSNLTSVTIPESVVTIEASAFSGCSNLTSVTIPESVVTIEASAFSGCSNLTSVTIPESVVTIEASAFSGCSNLTSVTIPESVTSIGVSAFSGCSRLTSVTIGESVTSIGEAAFRDCTGLTTITIPKSVDTIRGSTFSGCSGLTSVTIPESVTSIAWRAFEGCSGLTSVTIPESVTYIGDEAFQDCSRLTSVTIPESVTYIDVAAFRECSSLTSVTIPNSVTSIGVWAFYNCTGLTSVTIPESVTSIGEAAFAGCSGLRSVEWNAVACQDFHVFSYPFIDAYNNIYDCNITSITFGNQVKHIPSYLCSWMFDLRTVTIPESVTSIGYSAFDGLTSVYYTGNLIQWCGIKFGGPWINKDWDLYINNVKVTDLLIPDGVTSIGSYAFRSCSGLTSVTIPESVTSIGDSAFYGCRGLTSVTIPNSVTAIGEHTFNECRGLTSVYYTGNLTQWCDIKFGGPWVKNAWDLYIDNVKVTDLLIPDDVTTIGDYAFYGCSGLKSLTIPENVTTIGSYAFYGCIGLSVVWNAVACQDFLIDNHHFDKNIKSIAFGKQVTRIPAYLCYDLSGLTAITLPRNIDTIGRYAFSGCNKLLSVTSLSKIPPYCASAPVFSFYEGTLFVPRGCKMAYQTAQEWYKFSRIEETETIYTVTVQPNDAAMGRVTGGGEYQEGEQAILAAIPNQGYYFVRWDDGSTNNPRMLTVGEDITLTAIFAQGGDAPTANENSEADNFRVYVQDRTIYLSEARGLVQVYNMAGQCVYNGRATAIPVPHPGVYILRVADSRSRKILVR